MAYAKDITVITDAMKKAEVVFWCVYEPDGKTIISEQEDDISPSESQALMHGTLDSLEGTVKVVLSNMSKAQKRSQGGSKNMTYLIRLGQSQASQNNAGLSGLLDLHTRLMNEQIAGIKKDLDHEREIEKLQRKLKDKDKPDMVEQYLPLLVPVLSKFVGMDIPVVSAPGISGHEPGKISQEDIMRINKAVATLCRIDPAFVDTIETLAEFAMKKPKKYLSYIPLLKSQI